MAQSPQKRAKLIANVVVSLVVIGIYSLLYAKLPGRSSGYARGAGAYYHYRECKSDFEAHAFRLAAYAEAWLIRSNTEHFVKDPSWADLPQVLILKSPQKVFRFRASEKTPD